MDIKMNMSKLGTVNENGRVYPTIEELRQMKIDDMITFNSRYGSMGSENKHPDEGFTVEEILQWDDMFPEVEYSEQILGKYQDSGYLTPVQAFSIDISVFVKDKGWLHPRHWRYNYNTGIIVFLCHDLLVGEKIIMNVSSRSSILARRYMSKFEREGIVGGIRRGIFNMLDSTTEACKTKICLVGGHPIRSNCWKEMLAEIKGVGIVSHNDIRYNPGSIVNCEQFEDDRPLTVRGNGRQKLIDNGKGKMWPEARTRKGRK